MLQLVVLILLLGLDLIQWTFNQVINTGIGRSFEYRSFENSSGPPPAPPPPGGVRGWKNWLRGLVYPVKLGQFRNAKKSSIIGPPDFLSQFFKIQKNHSIKGGTLEVLGDERTNWGVYYILLG